MIQGKPSPELSCVVLGHMLHEVSTHDGQILRIYCARCHRQWNVEEV